MKKLLSLLCMAGIICFGFSESQAQDTRFGLKGGLTYYKATLEVGVAGFNIETESDADIGFVGGLFAEFPINDMFSIQPEVLYIQKNSKSSDDTFDFGFDDDLDGGEGKSKFSYIDVPVLLKLNIPVDGNVSPFIGIGPFVGYLLDAKATGDGVDEDLTDFMNSINYGLIFSGGVNFGNIGVELRYDMGMANIFDEDSIFDEIDDDFGFGNLNIDAKLSGFSLMLSIGF